MHERSVHTSTLTHALTCILTHTHHLHTHTHTHTHTHAHTTYRSSIPSGSGIISPPTSMAPPPSSSSSSSSSSPLSEHRSLFNSRTLAYQKTFRARRLGASGTRYYLLWGLSLFSLGLAWAIGRIDAHPAVLVLLVVAMVILWWDQGGRVLDSIEKQTEMRVCRRKTVQHSESAEWINLALNRW